MFDFLCVGCLEARIGRRLNARDFTDCLLNARASLERPLTSEDYARGVVGPVRVEPHHSARLRARMNDGREDAA